jgi:iron complex outermembrane receptor protein
VNLKNVISRGAESDITGRHSVNKLLIDWEVAYVYTRSFNSESASENDKTQGKQLVYVPMHCFTAGTGADYRHFSAGFDLQYTSERYTTSDNYYSLPSYCLASVYLGKTFRFRRSGNFELVFSVNNVTDTRYSDVANFPQPGRSAEATLRYSSPNLGGKKQHN